MPLPAITEIRSGRLIIRPVRVADLTDLMAVNGNDEATRYLPYESWRTPADAMAWFERMQALVAAGTARQLVIVQADSGQCIGTVLLFRFDAGSARVELGYVVGRAHWRQGVAREAVSAVLSHAFGALGIRRVEAEVNCDNAASSGLLLALGFTREGLLRQRWVNKGVAVDVHAYGLLAYEWAGQAAG